jgi:hypothetical protein
MRWRDTSHLERAVDTAGGQEAFDAAIVTMLADARSRQREALSEPSPSDRLAQRRITENPGWTATVTAT